MNPVVCILGPTASGKSELAMAVARRAGGEIINADSMQVYRGLSIGTGVPPAGWMAEVPHHLYQVLDLDEEPDAVRWSREAARAIQSVWAAGHLPLLVGGTFFWLRALFVGLSQIPPIQPEVRSRLRMDLARCGIGPLYERLKRVDPAIAARLEPRDTQRILRALEVFESTGVPLSRFQEGAREPAIRARRLNLVLRWERRMLYERIDRRVAEMVASGLVQEVRTLLDSGVPADVRALRSAMYRPVVRHVLGEIPLDQMTREVAKSHRHYAKRQETWLRHETGLIQVNPTDRDQIFRRIDEFLAAQNTRIPH